MDNRCPKCGKKLSLWYIKQNCPECGCNLLYYDMDKRLEEDAKKAEAEFAAWDRFTGKLLRIFGIKRKNNEGDGIS